MFSDKLKRIVFEIEISKVGLIGSQIQVAIELCPKRKIQRATKKISVKSKTKSKSITVISKAWIVGSKKVINRKRIKTYNFIVITQAKKAKVKRLAENLWKGFEFQD